jgi:O-succinylbenzoate synthase
MSAFLQKHTLEFHFEAKTSRNAFTHRDIYLLEISDNYGRLGVGEISPLQGLSPEYNDTFEEKLKEVTSNVSHYLNNLDELANYLVNFVDNYKLHHNRPIRFHSL